MKSMLYGLALALSACHAYGQDRSVADKIAASRGGASPLVYTTRDSRIGAASPGGFHDQTETTVREGLPRFFRKLRSGTEVTVAFLGGSITQADHSYRMQVSKYMERSFPAARFRWINAGISGTGTDLGAFRIGEQVLDHDPDLLFIEFAVNGAYPDGMEGMVRQVIDRAPGCDICLLYALYDGQTQAYRQGAIPDNVRELERIAERYGLPSIHMGMEAARLEEAGRLVWKGDDAYVPGVVLFSKDGIHPTEQGGALYAAAIARGLKKIGERTAASASVPSSRAMPDPVFSSEWEHAGMYDPWLIGRFDDAWSRIVCAGNESLKKFSAWFAEVAAAERSGASFRFRFEGDMFGIFDIGAPEAGQLEVEVNGRPLRLKPVSSRGFRCYEGNGSEGARALNRFNRHCDNRYRGQYDVVKLERGVHDVTVRISGLRSDKAKILGEKSSSDMAQNPARYDRTVVYLGRILIRGKPMPARIVR